MRALAAVAALLGSLAGVPAQAQDGSEGTAQRTPESAQRFLSEFFAQGGFGAHTTVRTDKGDYAPNIQAETDNDSTKVDATFSTVAGWSSADRCRSRIDLANMRALDPQWDRTYNDPPRTMAYEFDWSRVTAVETGAGQVQIRPTEAAPTIAHSSYLIIRYKDFELPTLLFATAEEAERIRFAAEFLRMSCGFKTDTGF